MLKILIDFFGPQSILGRAVVARSSIAAGRIRRLLYPLAFVSGYIRLLTWGLARCIFTLLFVVLVYALMVSDAGSDYLFGLAADANVPDAALTWWHWAGNVLWFTLWVFTGWFWSSLALHSSPYLPRSLVLSDDREAAAIRWIKRWLPTWLAGAGGTAFAGALIWIGATAPSETPVEQGAHTVLFTAALAVLAATLAALSIGNIAAARLRAAWATTANPEGVAILWRWVVFTAGAILLTYFLVAATINPVETALFWGGALNLVLVASMAWIGVGTTLILLGDTWEVPLAAIVAVYALLVSAVSNQHQEPSIRGAPPPRKLADAYSAWKQANSNPDTPMVLVATAGGGMRAAYWTTSVLGYARDHNPNFASQVFAISGVSGGSVGAAIYAALAAHGLSHCAIQPMGYQLCGELAVSHDLLGPTIAGFVFTDVLQGFIPTFLVRLPDRANALEQAVGRGWAEAIPDGSDPMGAPVDAIYAGSHPGVPELLLNGTSVRTGGRILTASVATPDTIFRTALDARTRYSIEPTLAEAAVNSARFPYVTPVATVGSGADGDEIGDGGYFENFGASTTDDLLRWILARPDRPRRIVVISISSDDTLSPEAPFWLPHGPCAPPSSADDPLSRIAPQARAPVVALLNGRTAHGEIAAWRLLQLVQSTPGVSYIPFRLTRSAGERGVPLSWSLSKAGQTALQAQLTSCPNSQAFALLTNELSGVHP